MGRGRTRVTGRVIDMIRGVPPRWIVAGAGIAVVTVTYPGRLSPNALVALRDARSRLHGDACSAAFALVWRVCELVLAGPPGLLLVQVALVAAGSYALLRRTLPERRAAWLTAALLGTPPILGWLGVVSSHAMMAACLVAGLAALTSERDRIRRTGIGAVGVAIAIQPSALVAALPLLVGTAPRGGRTRALAVWLATSLVALGANVALAHGWRGLWDSPRAADDLAAIGELRGPLLDGTGLRPGEAATPADRFALPADGTTPPIAQRRALDRAARGMALAHPGAYAAHRLSRLADALWLTGPRELAPPARTHPSMLLRLGVPIETSALHDAVTWLVAHLALLVPPVLAAAAALVLLARARRRPDVRALAASGLASELALAFTATSGAYACSAWLLASTCLAIALYVVRPEPS